MKEGEYDPMEEFEELKKKTRKKVEDAGALDYNYG